jgi:predicted O-methyltransferase YrrM
MNITTLEADPPRLHHWGEEWSTGGLNGEQLRFLHEVASRQLGVPRPRIVETGAGNSTIVFLMAKAQRVLTFALEPELETRIRGYCETNGVDAQSLEFIVGRSELTLPLAAMNNVGHFDMALIDGGHGWPTVFIDFCFLNLMLRRGGVLLVDDIQLHSVREVARLTDEQPQFERIKNVGKLYAWRKITDDNFLPDFGGQPYVVRKNAELARGKSMNLFTLP